MKCKRKNVRNGKFVAAYEARGRVFESPRAYHSIQQVSRLLVLSFRDLVTNLVHTHPKDARF